MRELCSRCGEGLPHDYAEQRIHALVARTAELEAGVARLRGNAYAIASQNVELLAQKANADTATLRVQIALDKAEAKLAKVVEALHEADEMLDGLPSGVDEEADFANCSPDDATAHLGGLIRQHLRAALAAVKTNP